MDDIRLNPEAKSLPVIELIDYAEVALGTAVQTVVKRSDEQAFAVANGQNLMFCEDAARRLNNVFRCAPFVKHLISGLNIRKACILIMPLPVFTGKEVKMLRKNPSGHTPVVSTKAYIDPTAVICGRVIIHDYVYVGPYAVIRADELNADGDMDPIIIHSHSNIQDGVVIHSKSGAPVTIGSGTSIAHRAIVHGPCQVDERVFIGFNSVLFNCHIQTGCVIRYNAVVDGVTLPENTYIPSTERVGPDSDLKSYSKVDPASLQFSEEVASTNVKLVEGYQKLRNEF